MSSYTYACHGLVRDVGLVHERAHLDEVLLAATLAMALVAEGVVERTIGRLHTVRLVEGAHLVLAVGRDSVAVGAHRQQTREGILNPQVLIVRHDHVHQQQSQHQPIIEIGEL